MGVAKTRPQESTVMVNAILYERQCPGVSDLLGWNTH
jgi:hypothetical protein